MEHGSQGHELKVGIFVLIGLVLVAWLALRFGDFDQRLGAYYPLTVVVRDASGIRDGSPVRLGGLDVGYVSGDPVLSDDATALSVPVLIEEGRSLPLGSTVKVATSGLMGDTYIRVSPPEVADRGFLLAGDTVSGDGARQIDEIADGALDTLERAAQVLEEIGRSLSSLNALVEKVDEELLGEENLRDLSALLGNLRDTSEHLVTASVRLEPLLDETTLAIGSVREAADGAGVAFEEVSSGVQDFSRTVETVDPVIREFDVTLNRLRHTLDSFDSLLRRVESGDGLASALLHDETLRSDLTSFVDKLERHGILFYPREGALLRRRGQDSGSGANHNRGSASASGKPVAPRPTDKGLPSASAVPHAASSPAKEGATEKERRGLFKGLQGLGGSKANPGTP